MSTESIEYILEAIERKMAQTNNALLWGGHIRWGVRHAYQRGVQDALMELRTLPEVAAELGIDRATAYRRARRLGIGWQVGHLLLIPGSDVHRLRQSR